MDLQNYNGDDIQRISDNEYKRMANKMTKIGYANGVNDGRESTFQKGFDEGYKIGLKEGFELEKFKQIFKHLNFMAAELPMEKRQYFQILSQETEKRNEEKRQHLDRLFAKLVVEIPKANKFLQKHENI